MGFKLDKEQDLGVIVKKEATGIMVTNKDHKTMIGDIGDTLMQRVDRSTYIITKAEMKESKVAGTTAAKKSTESKVVKSVQPVIDPAAQSGSAGAVAGTTAALDLGGAEKGEGVNGTPGEAGAAE
jgi:hypothetical protein